MNKYICHSRESGNPVLDPCVRRDDNKYIYLFKLKALMLSCIFIFCFNVVAIPGETLSGLTRTPAIESLTEYSVRSSVWKLSIPELSETDQKLGGTGFFITPNKLVTNFHVISALLDISKIEEITLSQEGNTRVLKIKGILVMSAVHDLALLETTQSVDHYLSIRRDPLQEQEDLFITGYPGGELTDMRKTSDNIMFLGDTTSFFVNKLLFGGSSGSPVVDVKKQVVGVLHSSSVNLIHAVNLEDLQVFVQEGLKNVSNDNLELVVRNEIENLRSLVEQGYASAQVKLSHMYLEGIGVPQNDEKAVALFKQAAEQGDAGAQFNLAAMYAKGTGEALKVMKELLIG